ncbi:hypothetical protein RF11_14140 [Thelohanellus kitauei]|uniref:Uncharacterized protein n=1 Tax=Thelohanellus kitauei TaxID=669202 RepID=A0A0C2I9P0_THEKT|nr:hypothetical protein RF11_14140 [Thelohanellus kitauei]
MLNNIDSEANKQAVEQYMASTQSHNLVVQMEGVRNFKSHLTHQFYSEDHRLLIQHFPNSLYDELQMVSEVGLSAKGYHELKVLFFEVFTFIFRYTKLVTHPKSTPFLELFLKFIKISDPVFSLNLHQLIDLIHQCISYEPNKILFINENGMYNFYCYFQYSKTNVSERFRKMCTRICDLDHTKSSGLCPLKQSGNINQIMNKYLSTKDEEIAWLLFTIFRMLYHLKLLDGIEFNISQFYLITHSIFLIEINRMNYLRVFPCISKIWTGILNKSTNMIQIDGIDKLILLSTIFAIDLSRKLKKVVNGFGKFEITKNKKQKFYVIYLSLVSFPVIDNSAKSWLKPVLFELHDSVQKFIEKTLLNDFSFDNKFLFAQYFIKSHVTLGIEISNDDYEKINWFLAKLRGKKQLSNIY